MTPLGPRRDAEPPRLAVLVAFAATVATLGLSFALAARVHAAAQSLSRAGAAPVRSGTTAHIGSGGAR